MRSSREITFRLLQEVRNAKQFAFPPRLPGHIQATSLTLADPSEVVQRLRETSFATEIISLADQILSHKFPVFGSVIETGPQIAWRRDYVHEVATDKTYFRLVPYLDVNRAGDHKNIWEVNRQQHLVALAQAFLFTKRADYVREIEAQLQSWWTQNPFGRGINWTSALEVAFRAMSWMWIYHLVSPHLSAGIRSQLSNGLYQHGRHIEINLSIYFSPNTHLLGEAVVLHALGQSFPTLRRAQNWKNLGRRIVNEELQRQVRPDGAHFEQSTYYHVYALDMFLFHATVDRETSPQYRTRLSDMARFLAAVMGPERDLPFLGDDDGGRWFHPYGTRSHFGRATLATCAALLNDATLPFETQDLYPQAAWWLGITEGSKPDSHRQSVLFPQSGLAVLASEAVHAIVDAGPFGPGRAGHSHSDSLSIVLFAGGKPVLVDSGTFTYVGDPKWRNFFRGTSAHSTIKIDNNDQAMPRGPFWWSDTPVVNVVEWASSDEFDDLTAECGYAGFVHRRRIHFRKPSLLLILDSVTGPPGEHSVKQMWQLGSAEMRHFLSFGLPASDSVCWHSPVFGEKQSATCLVIERKTTLPCHFAAAIMSGASSNCSVIEQEATAEFTFTQEANSEKINLEWPTRGR